MPKVIARTSKPAARAAVPPVAVPSVAVPSVAVPSVAVVVSRYNRSITDKLLSGALHAYSRRGGDAARVRVVEAPGAYELPTLAHAAAMLGEFRGVVALGCIIKGETSHDQHIAAAVAQGLVSVSLVTGVPCGFGVLTVDTPKQAEDRAGGVHGNKGEEAMDAVLDTLAAIDALDTPSATRRADGGMGGPGFGSGRRVLPDKARDLRPTAKGRGGTR